eukprot:6184335-Pleurochrysis_carterae.AAC.6
MHAAGRAARRASGLVIARLYARGDARRNSRRGSATARWRPCERTPRKARWIAPVARAKARPSAHDRARGRARVEGTRVHAPGVNAAQRAAGLASGRHALRGCECARERGASAGGRARSEARGRGRNKARDGTCGRARISNERGRARSGARGRAHGSACNRGARERAQTNARAGSARYVRLKVCDRYRDGERGGKHAHCPSSERKALCVHAECTHRPSRVRAEVRTARVMDAKPCACTRCAVASRVVSALRRASLVEWTQSPVRARGVHAQAERCAR